MDRRSGPRPVVRTLTLTLALVVVLVAVLVACSSEEGETTSGPMAPADAGTPGLRVDALSRAADGWAVPDPLPAGEPGQVIAVGATAPSEEFEGALRTDLLYHSTDRTGADRPVSGTLIVPAGDPPEGGWPVLSWAHGTSGVADPCAPSLHPNLFYNEYAQQVRWFLEAGYAVAASDFVGLGTPGMHSYSVGEDLGNAVADIVPAARSLNADLAPTWFAVGHSEGGQAALFATRAAARHPDLDLAATVAIAPSSNLQLALPGIALGAVPADVAYGVYFLAGLSTVDESIDVGALLGSAARPHLDLLLESGCLLDALDVLRDEPAGDLFAMPDAEMQRLSRLLAEVGDPDLEPREGPLLVVQGSEDQDVPQFLTDDLVASLEDQGVDLTYRLYAGEGHDTVLGPSVCETLAWLAEQGGPEPTACVPAATDLS